MTGRMAFEACVEAIFELAADEPDTVQMRVGQRLAVVGLSMPEAVHRMADAGMVELDGGRLRLTAAGEALACAVVRRHCRAESRCSDAFGLGWVEACAEGLQWEHVLSATVEFALAQHVGSPINCPYVNRIPDPGCGQPRAVPLASIDVGARATIERPPERLDALTGVLDDLECAGLIPGITVELVGRERDGVVVVRTGRGEVRVPSEVAAWLLVVPGDLAVIADRLRSPL